MCNRGLDLDTLLRTAPRPLDLRQQALPAPLQVLVLAPHPDDFDAVGLTLRHLHAQGHVLHLAVLTSGVSGVEDGFGGAQDDAAKAALREAEQRASCAFFGLPPHQVHFLRLWTAEAAREEDRERLRAWIAARPADLLFLPHGNDSNRTHRRTHETVTALAAELRMHAWALLHRDAKTREMRVDAFLPFSEEDAGWKGELLRCHASQQARNLRTRGGGFDARVLQVNRDAAAALSLPQPYAEVFELQPPATPPAHVESSAITTWPRPEVPGR